MIDAREPKNGDYASYVESLVNSPDSRPPTRATAPGARGRRAARAAAGARAGDAKTGDARPAQPPRRAALPGAPAAGSLWGNSANGPLPDPSVEAGLQQLRQAFPGATMESVGQLLQRAASFATIAGGALILLSFSDDPPFFASPALGMLLIVAGFGMRGLARRLR